VHFLGALACVRMGAIDEAERWLGRIDAAPLGRGALAVDVASLAGRIAKDRYVAARERGDDAAVVAHARTALAAYIRAFTLSGSAYPAVNAATLAALVGDTVQAATLARAALAALGTPEDHWECASAGEALLWLDQVDEARAQYTEAHRRAGARFGDIASMRHQLQMIGSPAALDLLHAVPAPHVIAFSGHMIDRAGRSPARFPPALEPAVAAALRDEIARRGPSVGYAQAACGADILFLEAMQAAGMQTQVVLPFAPAAFVETSVAFAGASWVTRFEQVLARATRVLVTTDEAFLGDDVLFEHAANVIQGMAFLRARELAARPLMLTVRDADAPALIGGATATARRWLDRGGDVAAIDLDALRRKGMDDAASARPVGHCADGAGTGTAIPIPARAVGASSQAGAAPRARSLKSLLFADISGFSKLPEQYTPEFAERFLGTCRRILDTLPHKPATAHTEGDGLFIVFDAPSHAALFAVRLQDALGEFDWRALGLPAETGARIGLHTGPLFRIFDPVTETHTYYGAHVNRTARLEPIVLPRQIFVTEEFAASLTAEGEGPFACEYIGVMPLAKQFGDARLYRLRAAASR